MTRATHRARRLRERVADGELGCSMPGARVRAAPEQGHWSASPSSWPWRALGGCTASRNGARHPRQRLFQGLPEALAAVHDRGHLAGERYLPPRALIVELHHVVVPEALQDASKVATCLVAFTGHYTASDVERGWAPHGTTGQIAIVVVRQRDLVLLATVVLGRIPPRLVFAHVFPRLH